MGKRLYSEEFKREALRRIGESGVTLSQVAREIGVKQQTLHRWQRQAQSASGGANTADSNRELERLRRENIRLKAERDILKKALGYFAKEPT